MGTSSAAAALNERQKRHLRGLAHALKPLIRIGDAGLTASLLKETERALGDHELIKVKAPALERTVRDVLLEQLAVATGSALVQRIGRVAVLYRARAEAPRLLIPDP